MKKKWLIAGGVTVAALAAVTALGSEAVFSLVSRRKSKLFKLAQKSQKTFWVLLMICPKSLPTASKLSVPQKWSLLP